MDWTGYCLWLFVYSSSLDDRIRRGYIRMVGAYCVLGHFWQVESMSKITKSAKGEACTIRVPGYCRSDSATTVFCHLNGAGMGIKHKDHRGAYGCSDCHAVVDGRVPSGYPKVQLDKWFSDGVFETQDKLIEKGLLIIA